MDRKNSIVFTPDRIGPLEIKNRLIRSATFEHAAEKGEVSDTLISIHRRLAGGGIGLIVTGISWAHPLMPAPPALVRADDDAFIPGLRRLAGAVHQAAPDCRIMLQLHHPGRQVVTPADQARIASFRSPAYLAYVRKHPEAMSHAAAGTPYLPEPIAPSAIQDELFHRAPRALTQEQIEQVIDAFAEGIRRAQEAGFDGAQLHAAHGWLLSSFLSPRTNQREDLYGGSTENRARIVLEIYRRARNRVGKDFPIMIKFNTTDFLPGGTDLPEAIHLGKIFSEEGFDALEASGGMWEAVTRPKEELGWTPVLLPESRTGIRTAEQEAYFRPAAGALKAEVRAKILSVGGYRSFGKIEETIASGFADFVSLARPLVRQPDLPNQWLAGGPDRAECISCNACLPVGTAVLACRADRGERI